MQASCQCGAITFRTPAPTPLKIYVCHCLECRSQSSSAFGISAMFPSFDIPTSESLRSFTRPTSRREAMVCYFCDQCGCRLVHGGSGQNYISVKGGCLKGLTREMMRDAVHIWTKRALVPIPNDAQQFEEEPPEEPGDLPGR